jgi:hypothetical protein
MFTRVVEVTSNHQAGQSKRTHQHHQRQGTPDSEKGRIPGGDRPGIRGVSGCDLPSEGLGWSLLGVDTSEAIPEPRSAIGCWDSWWAC